MSISSSDSRKRVLSGMRPTGKLHLGNYMGALYNWVRLQREYECYFFIADLHALTSDYADTSQLRQNTVDVALDFLAAGLDPEECTIFVQSHVRPHFELPQLLAMITPLGWLERVPTYKEQQENLSTKDLSTYGFLGYPLMMASDILLYQAHFVPVGQDQVAHVEFTREIARRFDGFYREIVGSPSASPQLRPVGKDILIEPQVLLTPSPKLPGTDGRKMSKSYGNTILLTDPEPVIRQKLKPMVTDPARVRRTDPGNPEVCPVFDLHKVFSSAETQEKARQGCTTAGIGCIECKSWVADAIVAELAPIQQRRSKYENDSSLVQDILEDGRKRATARAEQTMHEVRAAMGLSEQLVDAVR
ncbi:MAG TPA: tryptophan--tRNA ligase [Pseudacidobacterium sp.]|nr:tryptophan--tRNA ligase [Pseudacidobacterium sp.]